MNVVIITHKAFRKITRVISEIIYSKVNAYNFYINKVRIKNSFKIFGVIMVKNNGFLSIGHNFRCNSGVKYNPIGGDTICRLVVGERGHLDIGNNVGISNTTICSYDSITILDNTTIGGSCQIFDTDFHSINPYNRVVEKDSYIKTKPVIIRENVFIGTNCIILKGVEIGENSVIGAGSVVSNNIPRNEVWAGNPAVFIKKIDSKKI